VANDRKKNNLSGYCR